MKMELNLLEHKRNVYSQNGEDGMIEELFRIIGFESHLSCEFGAWDGIHYSNTKNLIDKYGFSSFMIEGNKSKFATLVKTYQQNNKVVCLNAYVDAAENSLSKLLRNKGIDDSTIDSMDLLSVDIDGLDYEILESLDIYPRLIIIEVNAGHDPETEMRLPRQIAKNNVGQPLTVFTNIAKLKGYSLIGYNGNAFFLQDEVASEFGIDRLSPQQAYDSFIERLSDNEKKWLTLVNSGEVAPFYPFNNPRLTAEKLGVERPPVPLKERLKKALKMIS